MSLSRTQDTEIIELRARLADAERTLEAIRQGEVDALLVSHPQGDQVYTLQGAEKPYRLLIESINEGALTMLLDGTVLYCNSKLGEMLQTPIQKITGASFYSFMDDEQKDRLIELVAGLPQSGRKEEFRLGPPATEPSLPVQLSLAPLEIDGVKSVGIIATDLTQTKRQEEILRSLNVALEQRVRERTSEVTQANESLKEAQAKLRVHAQDLERLVAERTAALQQSVHSLEQFCYTIAHDLRAPLRTMSGFSTSLVEDFGASLPAEGQDFARRIAAGAERMDQLIRDLLSYGRLNSGELRLVETEVQPILNDIIKSLDKNPIIRITSPLPNVLANPTALDQVLRNLLRNAVKFVAPGVQPEVRISAEETDGTHVRIKIQDNGIGVDPRFHDRIFRVFERLSADSYPGTGIGLAIVQKGVERMGGHVGLDSQPGKGSCFWIELRKAKNEHQI